MNVYVKTSISSKDEQVIAAQKDFLEWIVEKLDDYLFSEPDESEVRCEFYFRKDDEYQRKSGEYLNPKSEKPKLEIHPLSDFVVYCPCCGKPTGAILDEFTLKSVEPEYCYSCGGKMK